jgi:hypothetical protein
MREEVLLSLSVATVKDIANCASWTNSLVDEEEEGED